MPARRALILPVTCLLGCGASARGRHRRPIAASTRRDGDPRRPHPRRTPPSRRLCQLQRTPTDRHLLHPSKPPSPGSPWRRVAPERAFGHSSVFFGNDQVEDDGSLQALATWKRVHQATLRAFRRVDPRTHQPVVISPSRDRFVTLSRFVNGALFYELPSDGIQFFYDLGLAGAGGPGPAPKSSRVSRSRSGRGPRCWPRSARRSAFPEPKAAPLCRIFDACRRTPYRCPRSA